LAKEGGGKGEGLPAITAGYSLLKYSYDVTIEVRLKRKHCCLVTKKVKIPKKSL
jgi:hypothetical protein